MKKTTLALIVAGCTLFQAQAQAFGAKGHRITGAIAQTYLSEQAATQIKAIMGVESLAQTSTWPDEMRSDPDKYWKKITPPWHYVTVPHGKTYPQVGAPAQGDAYTALAKFKQDLQDPKSSQFVKRRAISFIVHLIGDLHQPLHVGNGTDRGGNDVKVDFFWENSNLHRVWDSGLIESEDLSYSEFTQWLLPTISSQNVKEWHQVDPLVWMAESQAIRMNIYPESDDTNLSYDYRYEHIKTVKTRLKQAGVRIAHYLNGIFAQAS